MKAFLLAAGLGTRLRPITENTPKCLVPINDKPLLQYWIDLFEKHNITEVCINLHYLSDQVVNYINQHQTSIKWTLAYEPELLGSGGTIFANQSFITDNEPFFICYADNLTNINLTQMLQFHQSKNSSFTMALFECNNPKECGIVEMNDNNFIIQFQEKPEYPKSNLANAGIYLANSEIFQYNKNSNKKFCDFGFEILPQLKMFGWKDDFYLLDIGTLEKYDQAQKEVKNGLFIP